MSSLRDYVRITLAYWAFTLTDGALRMLVLLHFHALGYSPVALAFLFLFYEFFGVVTNLLGGYVATRFGLATTLRAGIGLQVLALVMLARVEPSWSHSAAVSYVMATQALSGIAKDLTKMSAKSTLKHIVPAGEHGALFKWVALLTGSKNALKGAGFFLGGALLASLGYAHALYAMACALAFVLLALFDFSSGIARRSTKAKFAGFLSKNRAVNLLAAARLCLFGARDIWFVVGVPVYLSSSLGFSFSEVGSLLAAWVVGYGAIQALAPPMIGAFTGGIAPGGPTARALALLLTLTTALIAVSLAAGLSPRLVLVLGLGAFGVVFAINSSLHSYLILAYSDGDKVAMNVGFYYMANAGGRLLGTLLSGVLFQTHGVLGCLWGSTVFAGATSILSAWLPKDTSEIGPIPIVAGD